MGRVDPWTSEEDDILLLSYRDGLSDRAISGILDRTETAVRKRRQRLDLVRPMQVVDRDTLLQLHAEGRSSREISEALGCTIRTVQQLLWMEERDRKLQEVQRIWGFAPETWKSVATGEVRWFVGQKGACTVGIGVTEAEALDFAVEAGRAGG